MPRKLKDTELDNPTARLRLASRPEPCWRRVSHTCHLGYRRNKTGAGAWVGRFYNGEKYIKAGLGTADDDRVADGLAVLTFDKAQQAARQWFAGQERVAAGLSEQETGPYTVARCMADYLSWYAIHRKSLWCQSLICRGGEGCDFPAPEHREDMSLYGEPRRIWRGWPRTGSGEA